MVGCVIVSDTGIILGEGWHHKAGKAHAEVNAINNAIAAGYSQIDFNNATLYVSLEPCSHYGKTPPCADLVIQSGFKKVVVGTLDPHEKVAGNGIKKLQNAGIETVVGIEIEACNELNKRFFTYHKKQRPYIILKWAQTADGFIAPIYKDNLKPVWITNTYSRQRTHKMRSQEQAILVGAQTAIDDNPSLTTRDWYGKSPQRFVWSSKELPTNLALCTGDNPAIQIHAKNAHDVIKQLYEKSIQSIIIEGGSQTIQAFIDAGLWDEAHQFMGTTVFFKEGTKAPVLQKTILTSRELLKDDVLNIYLNK